MTTFLKGDTTAEMTLALAEGFDYSDKVVCLEYQGARRTFTGCAAGDTLAFSFTAKETSSMSLGAYPVRVWIEGGGEVVTVHNADVKLRVTDCIADVHGAGAIYLDVRGGLYGIDGLPDRWNENDLHAKINEIIRRGGGKVAMLLACALACALPALGDALTVQTAPKGTIYNDAPVVTNVALDAEGVWGVVSNRTDSLIQALAAIPSPDFSTSNATLVATIEATAPAPGNYAAVSNAAMNAASQTNDFLRLAGGGRISTSGYDFIIGYDRLLAPRSGIWWQDLSAPCGIGCDSLLGNLVFVNEGQWIWLPNKGGTLALRSDLADAATAATNYTDWAIQHIVPPIPVFDVYAEDVTNVADFVTSAAISTNNAAFVEAVRSTPLAGADQSDLAEIGEYGSYGTVGAAILALIAGLAALKRRIGTAETAISGKADSADLRYRIAEAEYDQQNDIYALADRTVNLITATDETSIDIELPEAVTVDGVRRARDFFLDIDNAGNASDLALEFTELGDQFVFVCDKDDSIGEIMTIGKGERVRLYFTECKLLPTVPVDYTFHVARVTLGDFVTSTTTTQGGN